MSAHVGAEMFVVWFGRSMQPAQLSSVQTFVMKSTLSFVTNTGSVPVAHVTAADALASQVAVPLMSCTSTVHERPAEST
jgi:hypothetical protein